MDLETYKKAFSETDTPGWSSIDARLADFYGKGEPDFHFGTLIKYMLGGNDPIDGVSIYRRTAPTPHLHFVSYEMSSLYYEEEAVGKEFSGWGFEFTFRLAMPEADLPEKGEEPPHWVINLMQNLARYVFQSGKWFEHGHFITANGPIRADFETDLVGLIFVRDPELGKIETPHGEVSFLQMVGITQSELDDLFANRITAVDMADSLAENNPLLLTDLARKGPISS